MRRTCLAVVLLAACAGACAEPKRHDPGPAVADDDGDDDDDDDGSSDDEGEDDTADPTGDRGESSSEGGDAGTTSGGTTTATAGSSGSGEATSADDGDGSSGDSGAGVCSDLEACCDAIGADLYAGCIAVVNMGSADLCDSILTTYHTEGYCTGEPYCDDLGDCCPELPPGVGWQDTCEYYADLGNQPQCLMLIGDYQLSDYCL